MARDRELRCTRRPKDFRCVAPHHIPELRISKRSPSISGHIHHDRLYRRGHNAHSPFRLRRFSDWASDAIIPHLEIHHLLAQNRSP